MKVEEILENLIKFNTVKDKENDKMIDFLVEFLTPLGFKFQYVKCNKTGKVNLLAKFNESKKVVLTFSGHMDTVPTGDNWTYKPFNLTQNDNKLYGLGSCDMKGGMAGFLSAVSQINLPKLKKGISLLFTYDEEIKFSGIIDFLKKVKLKTRYVIIAEPTHLAPQSAAKGVVTLKINFFGKEAHGGEPQNGLNAIMLANEFIKNIEDYFKSIEKQTNNLFPIEFATLNIAKIEGGDAINKVPASCFLDLEYRTINERQSTMIYQEVLKILRNMDCQFKIKIDLQTPPLFSKNKKFVAEIEQITKKQTFGTNGSNEGSYLCKYGYDCIVLGPGNDMSHKADEYIEQEQLDKAVTLYKKIIKKYCA